MKILSPELPQQPNEYRNTAPAWEERTENAAFCSCDFSRRDLVGHEFAGIKFVGCKFNSADLRRADFCDTVFENCDFSGATLRGASFRRAIFCGCKGMGADCSEGYFADARVEQCNFSYANFSCYTHASGAPPLNNTRQHIPAKAHMPARTPAGIRLSLLDKRIVRAYNGYHENSFSRTAAAAQ